MASLRDIKGKIQTVRSIEQICRALKTVSSIRLRRAEQRLRRSGPYREGLARMVAQVAGLTQEHRYLQPRPVERTAMVVVTSDRGLCGGYNAGVVRRALAQGTPQDTVAAPVGRKGLVALRRRGYRIVEQIALIGGAPETTRLQSLAARLARLYDGGEVDRVIVVYSRFLGGTRSEVTAETVIPVTPPEGEAGEAIFEPAAREMLPGLLSRYVQTQIMTAAIEASASEHAARVVAMTSATDNAEDMVRRLTLDYNKVRQASITQELTEIVAAAEATG